MRRSWAEASASSSPPRPASANSSLRTASSSCSAPSCSASEMPRRARSSASIAWATSRPRAAEMSAISSSAARALDGVGEHVGDRRQEGGVLLAEVVRAPGEGAEDAERARRAVDPTTATLRVPARRSRGDDLDVGGPRAGRGTRPARAVVSAGRRCRRRSIGTTCRPEPPQARQRAHLRRARRRAGSRATPTPSTPSSWPTASTALCSSASMSRCSSACWPSSATARWRCSARASSVTSWEKPCSPTASPASS